MKDTRDAAGRLPEEELVRRARDAVKRGLYAQAAELYFEYRERLERQGRTISPVILANYALCVGATRRPQDGLEICRKALPPGVRHPEVSLCLAKLHLLAGARRMAVEEVDRGLRAAPEFGPLGRLREQLGRRRAPPIRFLSRESALNVRLGKLLRRPPPGAPVTRTPSRGEGSHPMTPTPELYLEEVRREFRSLKRLVEKALEQVSDANFFQILDPDSNSVAVLVKHLGGNLRSRWTDFLTSDGEKADRRRDSEFEREPSDTRASLLDRWEAGWRALFATLEALRPEDLTREVSIRGEAHSVLRAINRALTHCAVHAGQIVLLSKHLAGPEWRTLSIARGKSEEFKPPTRRDPR